MCEMSKLSIRLGRLGKPERGFERLRDGRRDGLQHAKALNEGMLRVLFDQFEEVRVSGRAAGSEISTRCLACSVRTSSSSFALFEIHRRVDVARQIRASR